MIRDTKYSSQGGAGEDAVHTLACTKDIDTCQTELVQMEIIAWLTF